MSKLWSVLTGAGVALMPAAAWAEGMSGYSRGNAFLYFSAIAAILIFGVHDVFHKKWLTWGAAIAIPVFLYLNLPAK
ncbi:MAG TPA: hypothetical protein VFA38_02885 [Nitrospirales bacterium]|nr:hypothetical protein [Nitrospirales bacterium]